MASGERTQQPDDGPLLLTLLLTNQNQNQEAARAPVADTVQIRSSSAVLELKQGSQDYINSSSSKDCVFRIPKNRHPADGDPLPPNTSDVIEMALHKTRRFPPRPGHNHEVYWKPSSVANVQTQTSTNVNKTASGSTIKYDSVGLNDEQVLFWKRNGYLVVEDALDQYAVKELLATVMDTADKLFDSQDPTRKKHVIEYGDPCINPNGRLVATVMDGSDDTYTELEPLQRIRRMGVGVHRVLPSFRSAIFSSKNQQIAHSLGFYDPRVTQSLIIAKPSKVGANVVPHQDGCSNFTDPPGSATFWYALQDATRTNGCLQVAPGSHRTEPMIRRCRANEKGFAEFVELPSPIYAGDPNVKDYVEPKRDTNGKYVWKNLEVKAGTLVLMHGNLLHASDANHSSKSRVAFNFGVVEGSLPWPKDAYLQPCKGEDEFEKLEPKH